MLSIMCKMTNRNRLISKNSKALAIFIEPNAVKQEYSSGRLMVNMF